MSPGFFSYQYSLSLPLNNMTGCFCGIEELLNILGRENFNKAIDGFGYI
ncbi:hypothetical protein SAMN05661044_05234 [Olivibacter domesticus]|uniref:Uncharacterized protein n=1 Tax=Olivibacter domesticus TaxID=407022 RepID=A0A1H7YKB6_OLID1|nr:hypothetical protein SAMN05661044_05234 [Olivibacter domesticus]